MAFYYNYGRADIPTITTGDALGQQHAEPGSIEHPFAMSFTFLKDQILNKLQAYLQV